MSQDLQGSAEMQSDKDLRSQVSVTRLLEQHRRHPSRAEEDSVEKRPKSDFQAPATQKQTQSRQFFLAASSQSFGRSKQEAMSFGYDLVMPSKTLQASSSKKNTRENIKSDPACFAVLDKASLGFEEPEKQPIRDRNSPGTEAGLLDRVSDDADLQTHPLDSSQASDRPRSHDTAKIGTKKGVYSKSKETLRNQELEFGSSAKSSTSIFQNPKSGRKETLQPQFYVASEEHARQQLRGLQTAGDREANDRTSKYFLTKPSPKKHCFREADSTIGHIESLPRDDHDIRSLIEPKVGMDSFQNARTRLLTGASHLSQTGKNKKYGSQFIDLSDRQGASVSQQSSFEKRGPRHPPDQANRADYNPFKENCRENPPRQHEARYLIDQNRLSSDLEEDYIDRCAGRLRKNPPKMRFTPEEARMYEAEHQAEESMSYISQRERIKLPLSQCFGKKQAAADYSAAILREKSTHKKKRAKLAEDCCTQTCLKQAFTATKRKPVHPVSGLSRKELLEILSLHKTLQKKIKTLEGTATNLF